MINGFLKTGLILAAMAAMVSLAPVAYAAAPGITGPTFNLTAQQAYLTQPDGQMIYSWGYGCTTAPSASSFRPAAITTGFCNTMQVPGPTLIVTEGQTVTVTLTNGLPASAGNTSILFPGFNVTSTGGVAGLMTREAAPGGTVTYSFTPTSPGTRAYYSGTQGDLQVEMGLYGAVIVLPSSVPASCTTPAIPSNLFGVAGYNGNTESDFRLAASAYDHAKTCYDREYLFQILGDGSADSQPGPATGGGYERMYGRCRWMQPECSDGALPSGVLHDQRALHAG
jgi:FtsP/CotA-like multicopper oxidase with cupredoxin domain